VSLNFRVRVAFLIIALTALATLDAQSDVLAFPDAEGFGRFAIGGRGGSIYHVTNLNDSGAGSFRDAVSKPNRTIVFNVGGVIQIASRISVSSNITIAGQTAPGDGIVIYGNGVSFSGANNSITRHIRFRMGVKGDSEKDAITIANGHDMIFDHVSVSWGRDETFSISGPVTNITIQNCIIAQGLQPHSAGGLIQTAGGVSILRTLYVDNHTRNPKVKGVNQFVNNVVYNWGGGGCYILGDSESASFANVVGNYFITGPSSKAAAFSRGNLNFHIYAADNFLDANKNGALDGELIPQSSYSTVSWQEKPYDYPPVKTLPPEAALKVVTAHAGASLHRDEVDQHLIQELLSFGKLGETIAHETDSPMYGVGTIHGGSPKLDSDQDGMADEWETAKGLDPKNPDDRNRIGDNGYTRLEEYLNWLVEPHEPQVQ
jgi:pectate lyase